jgi:hypothetical protein
METIMAGKWSMLGVEMMEVGPRFVGLYVLALSEDIDRATNARQQIWASASATAHA